MDELDDYMDTQDIYRIVSAWVAVLGREKTVELINQTWAVGDKRYTPPAHTQIEHVGATYCYDHHRYCMFIGFYGPFQYTWQSLHLTDSKRLIWVRK